MTYESHDNEIPLALPPGTASTTGRIQVAEDASCKMVHVLGIITPPMSRNLLSALFQVCRVGEDDRVRREPEDHGARISFRYKLVAALYVPHACA